MENATMQPIDKIWSRLSSADKHLLLGHDHKTLSEKDESLLRAIVNRRAMARR